MSTLVAKGRHTWKQIDVQVDVDVDLVLADFTTDELIAEMAKRGMTSDERIERLCFDAERFGWDVASEDLRHELMRDGLLRVLPARAAQR